MAAGDDTEVFPLPYVFRPKHWRGSLTAMLGAAAVALAVAPRAEAACTATPTTKAFAAFGDYADYNLAPARGVRVRRDRLVARRCWVANGNEPCEDPFGADDSKSLAISAGGKACVARRLRGHPSIRRSGSSRRRTSGSWGVLNVKLRYQDASGATNEVTVGSVAVAMRRGIPRRRSH